MWCIGHTYILYVRDTRGKTKSRSHDFDYFLMFDDDEMKWWNVTLESTLVATLNTNGKRVNKINNNIKSKYRWLRKTKGMEPVLWWTDDIFFQSSLFKVFQCSFNHCYTKRHDTHTRESGVHSYNNNKNAVALNGLTDVCSLHGMRYLDKSVTIIMFKMLKVNILKKKTFKFIWWVIGAIIACFCQCMNFWTRFGAWKIMRPESFMSLKIVVHIQVLACNTGQRNKKNENGYCYLYNPQINFIQFIFLQIWVLFLMCIDRNMLSVLW